MSVSAFECISVCGRVWASESVSVCVMSHGVELSIIGERDEPVQVAASAISWYVLVDVRGAIAYTIDVTPVKLCREIRLLLRRSRNGLLELSIWVNICWGLVSFKIFAFYFVMGLVCLCFSFTVKPLNLELWDLLKAISSGVRLERP